MPWLEKDKVFLIHVPRCAGTSFTKLHKVQEKAKQGRNLYHKFGLTYFFYRYELYEKANFPFISIENVFVLLQLCIGLMLYFFVNPLAYPSWIIMWSLASCTFILSTFVISAPILARSRSLRRALQMLVGHWTNEIMASRDMVTGTGADGLYLHFTAERCIRYGLVSEKDMKDKGFSIVRNPYSRMVSIYMYNKLYFESFEQFCEKFYKEFQIYEKTGSTDDWDIYCHVLPMHAFTHANGKQLVSTIIKQEDLKIILNDPVKGPAKAKELSIPPKFVDALTGLPHTNSRPRNLRWQDYFTQRSMDLVLKMYGQDFALFGYSVRIPGRPDLIPYLDTTPDASTIGNTDDRAAVEDDVSETDSTTKEHNDVSVNAGTFDTKALNDEDSLDSESISKDTPDQSVHGN